MGKPTLTGLSQDSNSGLDITEVERVLESRHRIASLLGNNLHHSELLSVASDEVEERELVKALGLLVTRLDNLFLSVWLLTKIRPHRN